MPSATTTQGFALPEQAEAFRNVLSRAEDLFKTGGPRFPGFNTFVGPSGATNQALGRIESLANQGSPTFNAADQALRDTISGSFLGTGPANEFLTAQARGDFLSPDTNPFSRAVFDRSIAPAIQDSVNSSFLGSGRFGSAANTRVLADSLGDAANQFFGQQFTNERNLQNNAIQQLQAAQEFERRNQLNATQIAPQFAQARFNDDNALAGVGQAREAFDTAALQDRINRFNFDQNRPIENLGRLQSFALGGPVLTSQTQPLQSNTTGNILSGVIGGGLLGGAFGGIPGALIGGAGGGLFGAFS